MERTRKVKINKYALTYLFFLVSLLVILSSGAFGEGTSHTWTEVRHDSKNTGHVDGQGLVNPPIDPLTVEEPRGIDSNVISVDINDDGVNDMAYGNDDGSFIIREGPYSNATVVENILDMDGIISPVVYHARLDGPQRFLLLVASVDNSSILFIGEGSQEVIKRIDVNGTLENDWKILDVDQDGSNELVVTTFQGTVHSVDLLGMEIDWSRFIHRGLTQPIGYFEHEGAPKLALTSGISFNGWEKIGSKYLYILDGLDGEIDRVVRMSEEILATPPSIHVTDGEIYISYCNYTGTAFIYEYSSEEMYDTIEWETLARAPYWQHINIVEMPGKEKVYFIFQGDRYVLVYDLFSRVIVWTENINYTMDFIDSLIADINNDGHPELLLLRVVYDPWTSALFIKTLADGTVLQEVPLDVPDPDSLLISDMDGDGYLEVCVVFPKHLVFIDRDEYVDLLGVSIDGVVMQANSPALLYAMYKPYNLSVEMELSTTLDYIHRLEVIIDSSGLDVRREIDVIIGSVDDPVTEHIIFDDTSVHPFDNLIEINIHLMVNWSFPHEDQFAIEFEVVYENRFSAKVDTGILFKVENDVAIVGDLSLTSNGSAIQPGEWLNSKLPVRANGLTVTYQNAPEVLVDLKYFTIEAYVDDQRYAGIGQDDGSFSFDIDLSGLGTGTYRLQVLLTEFPEGIEVNELSSDVRVDADPVRIVSVYPSYDGWHSSRNLYMGLVTNDNNGSGVDTGSIQIRLGINDTFNETAEWEAVDNATIIDIGDGCQLIGLDKHLDSGIYLYQWRLTDRVHHGYTHSQLVELKVDIVEVEFLDPTPIGWVNSTPFQSGVTIRFGTPYTITRSYIQYSIWNPPGKREWTDLEFSSGETIEVMPTVNITVNDGTASFIQWRLVMDDGTVHFSNEHRLFVDTIPPEIVGVTPELDTLFNTHTVNIAVEITDTTSGIDLESIGITYKRPDGLESRIDHDLMEVSTNRVVISFLVENVYGKSNEILVEVGDMAENHLELEAPFILNVNEPPIIHSISPQNESVFRRGVSITFSVETDDPDEEAINISWHSDNDGLIGHGDTIEVRNLSIGIHRISVTVTDDSANHVNGTVLIHVEDEDDGGLNGQIPRNYLVSFIVIVVVIIISTVIVRYRRHRYERNT
jgi:hypothetical protein